MSVERMARAWHEVSDHAADGMPFGGPLCNCERIAERAQKLGWSLGVEHSDAVLDAVFESFKAHSRGVEFNDLGEHVCKECGYAYSWPEGEDRRYVVPFRRSQRHIAHEALRAAGGAS
jgi:hypothetical protein